MDENTQYQLHFMIYQELNEMLKCKEFCAVFENENQFVQFFGIGNQILNMKNVKKAYNYESFEKFRWKYFYN